MFNPSWQEIFQGSGTGKPGKPLPGSSFSEAKVGAVSKEGFKKKAACNQCNFLEFKKSNDSDGVPNMLKTLIWLKRV